MINSMSFPQLPINNDYSPFIQAKNFASSSNGDTTLNNPTDTSYSTHSIWKFTFKEQMSKYKIIRRSDKIRKFLNESQYSRNKSVGVLSNIYVKDDDRILESIKDEVKQSQRQFNGRKVFSSVRLKEPSAFSNESPMDFYEKYKQFLKMYRLNHENNLTPSFAFIKSAIKSKLVPNPIGFICRQDESKVELTNSMVGDNYINAMSSSFNSTQRKLKQLMLGSNRISSSGINTLFTCINMNQSILSNLTNLDLSNNKIGAKEIEPMLLYLKHIDCQIEKLNLERNQLGDSNVAFIANALAQSLHQTIKEINLASNNITSNCVESLVEFIQNCKTLLLLNLNCNNISNEGAAKLFKLLKSHIELKVLYLAWNNIGTSLNREPSTMRDTNRELGESLHNLELYQACKESRLSSNSKRMSYKKTSQFAEVFGEYCKAKTQSLVHLDLSNNYLSFEDCEYIANEIRHNHSLLGIHSEGNEMIIDSLGFIHPMTKQMKDSHSLNSQIYFKPTQQMSPLKRNALQKIKKRQRSINCSNCWICEGWSEVGFSLTLNDSKPSDLKRNYVKLHLSIDEWKPYDLIQKDGTYEIIRMCPPGDVYYFYTINLLPTVNRKEEVIELASNEEISFTFSNKSIEDYHSFQSKNPEAVSIMKGNETISVKTIGHKTVERNLEVINEDYKRCLLYCYPRPKNLMERLIKPRIPWSFSLSIWAYYDYFYTGDSEDYLSLCFEHDFKRCSFEKDFNEEDLLKVRNLLRRNYREILNCYKQFSSLSGFTLWQISQNNLADFISKCNDLCDKKYDINNVFIVQTGICANPLDKEDKIKNGNKNIGDNLIRHQFLSLLIKVPRDKYVRGLKTIETTYEAIEYSFTEHFAKGIAGYDSHQWRKERYYNEQVDNFLKAYYPVFDSVFKSWAKQKGPRKKDIWMVLDEFNNLIQCIVDCNEYSIRDNPLLFNWSIRLQISEVTSDKHLTLLFPEFLEAICRVIDKASPYPTKQEPDTWPMPKRMNQPLVKKLENSIDKLIKVITHPDHKIVKDKFIKPIKDQLTDLYILDCTSNFYQGALFKK